LLPGVVLGDEETQMALLTIGAFARRCRLSAKALRLYDNLGLLTPVETDPVTGYRWYAPEQLELARLVAWLRRIGMPLAQIAIIAGLSRSEAVGQIAAYWQQVQAEHTQRAQLVSALVDHLERGDTTMAEIRTPLRLRWATYCDQGLVREHNQDSVWAGDGLLGVADGFGAADDTEPASAVALRRLASAAAQASPGALFDVLQGAAAQAAEAVRAIPPREDKPGRPGQEMPGTTLTALAWAGGDLALVHVGDSRAYVLRAGQLFQLTHDDTYVQRLIDEGKLTEDEARSHPQRMTLIKALHPNSAAVPQVSAHSVQVGDRYLLCTDGLHLPVTNGDIQRVLCEHVDVDSAVAELGALAHRAGAPDNVVCVVADVLTV
jgi:serine/threonine protein phosphatase PrpC